MSQPSDPHRSGYVALVGKPNAGKSTLFNALVGARLSIITPKPQTTRHRIVGIFSDERAQIIFLDTPGVITPRYRLQEMMMNQLERVRQDADLVLYIRDVTGPAAGPVPADLLSGFHKPVYLILNKIDLIPTEQALPLAEELGGQFPFREIFPLSALKNRGVDALREAIIGILPPGPPFYPKDQVSEHPERFFITELVREQVFLRYKQEIPYSSAVNIVQYSEEGNRVVIDAEIVVDRESQKGIIIGKGGHSLKHTGIAARKAIEEFLGMKVRLNLHVKARERWRDKDSFLRSFGYDG